jgi:carbonic anhydrase/acetyltransferase-like protein (isoleucine patch superfamily)
MPIYVLPGRLPQIDESVWLADNAVVIGKVSLGKDVSIWWNAVLRGDNDTIAVGEGSNIQDGSVLHTDEGIAMTIGARVTVGHMVMLHGCSIGDDTLIGIGAIILNRAVVGRECLIGAGTLIPEGKIIPDRSVVMGSPGKVIRQVNDDDLARIRAAADHYVAHIRDYRAGLQALP